MGLIQGLAMFRKQSLLVAVAAALSGCGSAGLSPLAFTGADLHPSLVALPVQELPSHIPRSLLRTNPQLSTEADFVEAVARGGSQGGRFDSRGVRAALYAVYRDDDNITVGVYGMEAESEAEADRREDALRAIWAYNDRANRTRVHRGGNVVAVVFSHPATPAHWEAVNEAIAERIGAAKPPAELVPPASAVPPAAARGGP